MKQTPKLLILRGISASGKTTLANELELKGWVRVEKDDIRTHGNLFKDGAYDHARGDETIVTRERDRLIRLALREGRDVVSSDTNLNPQHVRQLQAIGRQFGAEVSINDTFLSVPLRVLIERDASREDSVGEGVIRKQFHEYVKNMPTFLQYDPNLPWCIVSDIDSTITDGPKNRTPYEYAKVGNDEVNLGVAKILDGVRVIDATKIFLITGRSESCRAETEDWLDRNDIEYDGLYMRDLDREDEPDTDIKASFIELYLKDQYNILFWLEDRPRVCTMLRDVYGINVLQRGDPYYKF